MIPFWQIDNETPYDRLAFGYPEAAQRMEIAIFERRKSVTRNRVSQSARRCGKQLYSAVSAPLRET